MDREESDLPPVRSSTSARSLVPPAALSSLSSSVTSASSGSGCFKKFRRPLRATVVSIPGVKQSNDIRPRRVVAPAQSLAPGTGARRFRDSLTLVRLEKNSEDVETVLPSFPGTVTKYFDESFNPFDLGIDQASCDIDWKEKGPPPVSGAEPLGDSSGEVQFSMWGNVPSQGPYARVSTESGNLSSNWLRFYWQQILQAVRTIHDKRIVHSDLKPANFLLVKGSLKLIDFGIANAIMSDTTNIQRDSQVGTLSYMSPEAFMCNERDTYGNMIKCGRPSDIWSLGCILYQMVYGRTLFSEYKTFWSKLKAITDPNHKIVYEPISNPWFLDIMKKCLAWDRNKRWRIPQLLSHPFLVPPVQSCEDRGGILVHLMSDASALCLQLKESMDLLNASEVESLAFPNNLCSLLSEVSKLCLELQEHVVMLWRH